MSSPISEASENRCSSNFVTDLVSKIFRGKLKTTPLQVSVHSVHQCRMSSLSSASHLMSVVDISLIASCPYRSIGASSPKGSNTDAMCERIDLFVIFLFGSNAGRVME